MKVLHIIAQLPSKTGSGVYFSNLIEEFNSVHDNYALYGHQDGIDYDFNLVEDNHKYIINFDNDELDFHIVGMSDIMPYKSTKYKNMTDEMLDKWIKNFKSEILKAYNEVQPDIIICHHLWILTSLVVDLLRDKCDRIIGICHGTDIRQALQNPKLREKYVRNIHKLDKIFALSENQIPEINSIYNIDKDKIVMAGGGYNQRLFYRNDIVKEDGNEFLNIVYAGKISKAKGVFELIDAFKSLNYGNDIILNIIGTPQGKNIEKIHKKIKETENIKIFNAKNQESLAELFRYSSIFILPSYFEGLGLVAIEALASGMFVVSSKLDPLMEALGEKVNKSNAIEYVELPRLVNIDIPLEDDIPKFVKSLAIAIDNNVKKVRNKETISFETHEEIKNNSWNKISTKINHHIMNIA